MSLSRMTDCLCKYCGNYVELGVGDQLTERAVTPGETSETPIDEYLKTLALRYFCGVWVKYIAPKGEVLEGLFLYWKYRQIF